MRQFWNEYLCRELYYCSGGFSFASTRHFLRPCAVTRQVQQVQGHDERPRHLLLSEPRVSSFVGDATQRHIGSLLGTIYLYYSCTAQSMHAHDLFFGFHVNCNKTISTVYSYSRNAAFPIA